METIETMNVSEAAVGMTNEITETIQSVASAKPSVGTVAVGVGAVLGGVETLGLIGFGIYKLVKLVQNKKTPKVVDVDCTEEN